MKEVHIEKIASADSEDELESNHNKRYTLRLYNEKQPSSSSIYLLVESKQDLVRREQI